MEAAAQAAKAQSKSLDQALFLLDDILELPRSIHLFRPGLHRNLNFTSAMNRAYACKGAGSNEKIAQARVPRDGAG
jgi:hypothetical protein